MLLAFRHGPFLIVRHLLYHVSALRLAFFFYPLPYFHNPRCHGGRRFPFALAKPQVGNFRFGEEEGTQCSPEDGLHSLEGNEVHPWSGFVDWRLLDELGSYVLRDDRWHVPFESTDTGQRHRVQAQQRFVQARFFDRATGTLVAYCSRQFAQRTVRSIRKRVVAMCSILWSSGQSL